MKIVITGGLGFIVSRFAHLCVKHGMNPIIIDKETYASNIDRLDGIRSQVDLLRKDICDVVEHDLIEAEYIVNFAAESHVDNSIEDGDPFVHSNVKGVFNLLEQSKNISSFKKFIQVSTDEVYGDIDNGISKETDSLLPSSYYSATKASADLMVKAANRTYGIPYIITRACNNYGPNQHPEKLIPKVQIAIANQSSIPVYTPGTQTREWIHVDDHCLAIYKIMLSSHINEIYNIGSGERYTNLELIDILANGQEYNISMIKDRLGHDKRYALDCSKYQWDFGQCSFTSLSEWIKLSRGKEWKL